MPVPKRKHSKGRTRRKRHEKLQQAIVHIVKCKNCGAAKLPHRVCKACGK